VHLAVLQRVHTVSIQKRSMFDSFYAISIWTQFTYLHFPVRHFVPTASSRALEVTCISVAAPILRALEAVVYGHT
jgi:hypothetical protein